MIKIQYQQVSYFCGMGSSSVMKNVLLTFLFLMISFPVFLQEKGSPATSGKPAIATTGVDRAGLIAFAKQYLGKPYRKASMDPKKGFDCSGFVYFVFNHFSIDVPRSSGEYKALGTALKPQEFKEGDVLVFYGYKDKSHIGHVGIIVEADGMKSRFIHASSGKAYCVIISSLESQGYHGRFYKCIDVMGK
ncbi:MAG: C40 family peptidase [Bacteroidetes bacterium]|nr:C40 family peptidase [Bacteroidota bacterium]